MSLRERRGSLRWLAPLALLFALTSCGPFDAPAQAAKVDVDTLSTNILFGAPTTNSRSVRPPAALPPLLQALPGQPDNLFFSGGDFGFPTTSAGACPAAPTTSFPAQVATSDVTTMPASGAYQWVGGGSWIETVLSTQIPLPVPAFEQRVVRRAHQIQDAVPAQGGQSDFAFTYQTIEPLVSNSSEALLMMWQVKANATSVNNPPAPSVADPEAGLVLKQVDVINSSGTDTGPIFSSGQGPGLLVLPLPVQPGTKFNSASIDTSTGHNTLNLSGTVGDHENVDACGTWLQAWAVDATLAIGASAATPTKLHFDVATQMGALIIAMNIDGNFFGTQFKKGTARIGQTSAGPVPDKYR